MLFLLAHVSSHIFALCIVSLSALTIYCTVLCTVLFPACLQLSSLQAELLPVLVSFYTSFLCGNSISAGSDPISIPMSLSLSQFCPNVPSLVPSRTSIHPASSRPLARFSSAYFPLQVKRHVVSRHSMAASRVLSGSLFFSFFASRICSFANFQLSRFGLSFSLLLFVSYVRALALLFFPRYPPPPQQQSRVFGVLQFALHWPLRSFAIVFFWVARCLT